MVYKRKNDENDNPDLVNDHPEIWYTGKLKRDAPFWQRVRYGRLLPTVLFLQTSCLLMICAILLLLLTGRITLQSLLCQLIRTCPTATLASVTNPTIAFTLVARTRPPLETPTSTVSSTAVRTRTPFPTRTYTPTATTAISTTQPTIKAAAASACDSASPEHPNSQIAFISRAQYGDGAVYLLDTQTKQICFFFTHNNGVNNLVWSPNGKHIAFTSPGGDIWLAGSKGQNQERIGHITWARDTVSWSPDSQKILFSDKDETLTLYYLGSKTTGPLTRTDFKAHTPRWSPDGTVIVAIVGRGIESELYIIDSNGSNPQRVTMNNLQEEMPDWSVNSQEIVYDAEVDDTFAVFVMNRDGTNIRRLSNSNYSARFPSVASTAGSIVYVLNRRERNEIAVMDWNGANFSVLTNNNDDEVMPTWRR